jgi:hypothetical protein
MYLLNCCDNNFWKEFDVNSIINLLAIIVNIVIGVFILNILNKRISDKRALKDFIIKELIDVRELYRKFLNDLTSGKKCSRDILDWFKIINIRTTSLAEIIEEKYNYQLETKDLLHQLRVLITGAEEFNESFNDSNFTPRTNLQNEIIYKHNLITKSFINAIVQINKA